MSRKKKESTNPWLFNGKPFAELTDKALAGFVYIIKHKASGKQYIGKKSFWMMRTPPGKKRKQKLESDWKTYWSSSATIKALVKEQGEDAFERHIIALCKEERMMNYLEVKYQFALGCIEDRDRWLNDNIAGRWYPHLYSKQAIESSVEFSQAAPELRAC